MPVLPRLPQAQKAFKANFTGTFRALSSMFVFTEGPYSGPYTSSVVPNQGEPVVRCERTGLYVPESEIAEDGFGRRVWARYAYPYPEGVDKIPTWRTR